MRDFKADVGEGFLGARDALGGGRAVVDEGQLDVVQRGGAGQQVEGLEDEADFLVADAGELVVVEFADQLAVEPVLALGRRVEAADQVHQRRLAGAGRSHDGDVLVVLDAQMRRRAGPAPAAPSPCRRCATGLRRRSRRHGRGRRLLSDSSVVDAVQSHLNLYPLPAAV